MEINDICEEKMMKALDSFQMTINTVRTGHVGPSALDKIEIDYYGSMTPINQVGSITSPEPAQLLVKPYDKGDLKAIEKAISAANLGVNPVNDGTSLRLSFPPLTGERRKELIKVAKKYLEEAKIVIRNIRRDMNDLIKKDKTLSKDMVEVAEKDIQNYTDDYIKQLEKICADKEKEIEKI